MAISKSPESISKTNTFSTDDRESFTATKDQEIQSQNETESSIALKKRRKRPLIYAVVSVFGLTVALAVSTLLSLALGDSGILAPTTSKAPMLIVISCHGFK